jgi:hypothetical protein
MKLSKIELAEFSAAARLFPSKVITIGSRMADGSKVNDINLDDSGHVWLNRGEFVLPVSSLVYWKPVDADAEWSARFGGARIPPGVTFEQLMGEPRPAPDLGPLGNSIRDFGVHAAATADQISPWICATCHKACASAAGLAAHMRGHK